jgi:uncharacterized membrane protein YjfL (UPF0719 family)
MNVKIFTLATVHLILALVIGVVLLYFTFQIVKYLFVRRKLPTDTANFAFGIFAGAVMFTVGYIISGVIEPLLATSQILMKGDTGSFLFVLTYMKYVGLFLLVAIIATALVIYTAMKAFDLFTSTIDEFQEISNGNSGVALVLSAVIIVVALLAKPGVSMLIEALVPFPSVTGIG